ncbi:methionyl-tRNA formyltransferase [Bordetella avium]|uniref:Methionyl-tRNA formyltransferase n=1 Tax=Bordetella avium (strain 197N) TaxID=360910 RepID=FMT_BORA1|nr:methionyl-tRNA formyltransferase [Bordetella avium]Q2L0K7.1 RecName: Full=Methionyl-tRNA formyltransferase [Bordetella avium 197N]AZY47875.1 methionyl-tRNA formyltransferase [Bordetella avium]RIQ53753.1 methionyl-tRNA formyltransferase [Bordetella avium]RIQ74390.1 methionyl-tRNA formyltransferase [Bordetella avium]CAJ47808.1 methionyl-tRNA formyltransferase [Bordetella avium 197N]
MRLVFAGTPEFARLALEALLAAGHEIPLVLTQPDRPAGRGLKLTPSPVKEAALAAGIEVAQPRSLRLDGRYPDEALAAQARLVAVAPEVMVVAAYGLILPRWTLALPARGCLNIHASLLPRWRGAAPIQRAIEAGDARTGVTIMQMDDGLDTGDMLLERTVPIGAETTAAVLHDELARVGAEAIVAALADLPALAPRKQPEQGVTYAAKLDKAEAALKLDESAELLARRIRAFNPVPGASLRLPGLNEPVKVWQAEALPESSPAAPGTVLRASAQGVDIATGQGVLRLLELQKAGGKRQSAEVFVRGWQPA